MEKTIKSEETLETEIVLATLGQTQIMLDFIFDDLYKVSPLFVSTYILNRVQWLKNKTDEEKKEKHE